MKKKIVIGAFLLLVFLTAILFFVSAVESYRYDMDPANGVDLLEGLGAGMLIALGMFVIFCEFDLFFTVYYFAVKPKTTKKTVLMILSQLMLLLVIFVEELSDLLFLYVSDIFREEIIVALPIFFLYVTVRLLCVGACFSTNP